MRIEAPESPEHAASVRAPLWKGSEAEGFRACSIGLDEDQVFVASLPLPHGSTQGGNGLSALRSIKDQLANHLWKEAMWGTLISTDSPVACDRSAQLSIAKDSFGKPLIVSPKCPDVHLSFSYGADRVWAALVRSHRCVGIDVAHPSEFGEDYPFHQAFHDREWSNLPKGFRHEISESAACLWTMKEAAVKCLGCGFHLLGPRDLLVTPCHMGRVVGEFRVWIRPFHARRANSLGELEICSVSRRVGDAWLAVALCDCSATEVFRKTLLPCREGLP